ncbi:hypothetical protein N7456_004973 [Penicillium angulare]|uniref:Hydrophobin n=1 Tax=Penicillium angulare TaxID=116970 RepID=A0A9W9KK28_9EURO|nr:hypothetical protein N7456_004973 [Penicillium angulare]
MLVKNIFATVAIATLAIAAPAEDIEARASVCPGSTPPGNSWCCQSTVPFSFLFIQSVGKGCNAPTRGSQGCPRGTSPQCCQSHQIVDKGNVVCTQ